MTRDSSQPDDGMFRLGLVLAFAAGVALGVWSAWFLTGSMSRVERLTGSATINNGGWTTGAAVAEADMHPLLRAYSARSGLWGLPPSEVIYYLTDTDSEGRQLDNLCTYEIHGAELPARWWSVSLYRDDFWVPNPGHRYSWAATTVEREPDGRWVVTLDRDGTGRNGLAMGGEPGDYSLSLRLYHPQPHVKAERATIPLPEVRRLQCAF